MMSSGWGSLEAKCVARGEDTGEIAETSTDKNEALSTKASVLESLEAMSLREKEQSAKDPESIGTDTDDGTAAVDTGITHTFCLDKLWVSFFQSQHNNHIIMGMFAFESCSLITRTFCNMLMLNNYVVSIFFHFLFVF